MKRLVAYAAASVFLLSPTSELSAQWDASLPGTDIGSISVFGGVVSPSTTFGDGSSFDSGAAVGATITYWPSRNFGLRSGFVRAETDGVGGDQFSPIDVQSPVVWLYSLDAMARHPMVGDQFAWFPYVAAGFGGKSYRWNPDRPRAGYTSFAWNAGAGIDFRLTRSPWFGLFAEARAVLSDFDTLSFNAEPEDHTDLVFTVGVTLNR